MTATAASRPRPHRRRLEGGVVTAGSVVAALVWISPLILLVISALRPLSDFLSHGPVSWPGELTLANFPEAWAAGQFGTAYLNSAFLLVVKVPLGVFIASLLAYALSKLEFPFRSAVLFTVVLGMTIPIYIAIVPLFSMLRSAGMTDSIVGIIPPYIAFGLPFEVLVLQAFFRRVPDELIEAARLDGAGDARIFFRLVLPLSVPALVTVGILDAVSTWNELFLALSLLSSEGNRTIPLGLLNFQGQFATNYTGLAAGILIAVVPILVLYLLLQKYIVGGLTAGATKG
ncbi:carbohydrate ABC transporter permease [Brachybacterium sp. NBEC-018]|uniref:carbohydrate ABC transporter permease n=1 Tax=Brachybacterium sp. NBEC-018 TaxID=2996004 RepID=UPI0021751070|nr:carbohydrate ABC transporter permease [Brachybacterium sp. NBEC-018]UVY84520.1 carbohydrate ABC transporter permease [Brachybacterium sp. NBEC-018]